MSRRTTSPVEDRRYGTPAQQVGAELARFRAAGLDFEAAWEVTFDRIKWPHNTAHRMQWKAIIEAGRHQWEAAYLYVPPIAPIEAVGSLAPLAA